MKKNHTSTLMRDAINSWHEQLAAVSDPEALIRHLWGGQEEQGLLFHGRPFCTVARPRFVPSEQMRQEHRAASVLSRVIRKVRDGVLADEALQKNQLRGIHDWIGTVFSLEPHAPEARAILRFDSFLAPGGFRFVEVNGDIPMGSVVNDPLVSLFQGLPFYEAYAARYDMRPSLAQIGMIQTFTHAWQAWGGAGTPRMCILSFPGGLEDIFARLNARDLGRLGLEVTAAHPQDLEFSGGRLRAKGRVVDLVYRIMHTDDCVERAEEMAPLLAAVRQRAVCMVNPFRADLLSHKYFFALMTDERHDFGISSEEAACVRAHVPWGRVLREGFTLDPAGNRVDLLEYVADHRDQLVLKPAHAAGAAGVVLGWRCDEAAWADAIATAVQAGSIVQERIDLCQDEYPVLAAGFPLQQFYEDTDPFYFPGGYSAMMCRLSVGEITNVATGGSIIPTFAMDTRQ